MFPGDGVVRKGDGRLIHSRRRARNAGCGRISLVLSSEKAAATRTRTRSASNADATPHDPGPELAGGRAADVMDAEAEPIEIAGGATVRVATASWTDPTMTAGTVFYPRGADTA